MPAEPKSWKDTLNQWREEIDGALRRVDVIKEIATIECYLESNERDDNGSTIPSKSIKKLYESIIKGGYNCNIITPSYI
ncbi:hypothetical protein J4229_00265 [Candidatus Pacearchaeota archaeon]|nr:hypothetical protein [Candidatus Pacearchaeota archaeon]